MSIHDRKATLWGLVLVLLFIAAWTPFIGVLVWLHHLHFPLLFWRH